MFVVVQLTATNIAATAVNNAIIFFITFNIALFWFSNLMDGL